MSFVKGCIEYGGAFQMKLKGMKVEEAIQKIIERSANAVFIAGGDIFRGNIRRCPNRDKAKFIYLRGDISYGEAVPDIHSNEFMELKVKALDDPLGWVAESYNGLKYLAECKNAEIILLQFDWYTLQIWQLATQAYIEQLGITDHIQRLCIDDSSFCINSVGNIDIGGSHKAFYSLVCRQKPINLEKYLIEPAAVQCYLDINSTNGELRDYIKNVSSQFENPYRACGRFFADFPKWGGEEEFLKIAMETLSQDEKCVDKMKHWKRVIKKERGEFIRTGCTIEITERQRSKTTE